MKKYIYQFAFRGEVDAEDDETFKDVEEAVAASFKTNLLSGVRLSGCSIHLDCVSLGNDAISDNKTG